METCWLKFIESFELIISYHWSLILFELYITNQTLWSLALLVRISKWLSCFAHLYSNRNQQAFDPWIPFLSTSVCNQTYSVNINESVRANMVALVNAFESLHYMSNFVLVKRSGYVYQKMRVMNGLDHWTIKIVDEYEDFILSLIHKDKYNWWIGEGSLFRLYKVNIIERPCSFN